MIGRAGFALITVVLLMIGLGVLATGLVFAAAQQATVAATLHDMARARLGAEAAVSLALADWSAAARSLDPVGTSVPVIASTQLDRGVTVEAWSVRLDGRSFLVAGSALVRRGASTAVRRRAERIVRSLDVDSLVRALDAAVIAPRATLLAGAAILGADPDGSVGETGSNACAGFPSSGSALRVDPDSLHVAAGVLLDGAPAVISDTAASRFLEGLGHLGLNDLRLRAGAAEDSTSGSAKEGNAVLRHAPGNLLMSGDSAAGVLLVDGDLVMERGARFHGILLVLGTATIRDASVDGVLLAGDVEIAGSARLDRCAIADALLSIEALRRPHPPARSWLPTFD